MKHCRGCDRDLPREEFHRHRSTRDGLQARCKACQGKAHGEWSRANRDRANETARRSRARTRGDAQLRRLYGVTADEVATQVAAQGDRCGLCKRPAAESHNGLHVDHDHATGRVRSLLCQRCNTALGKFGDDPALLRLAADYLDFHRSEGPTP